MRELAGLLQAIEEIGGLAVGGGSAADQDARRTQPLETLDVGAPVALAAGQVVGGGRDGDVEDDHGREPTRSVGLRHPACYCVE
ncbi:MAG: hypothetical protein DMD92_11605 [Candidatus Rokuibacteriota bacterium]|nr:MAG: hypothetical protein DMD92_11605 [Candidatus Rokubacteria bacterium]